MTRGEGEWGTEEEGSSQGIWMKDPWTKTMGGRIEGGGWGWVGQGRLMGEKWGQL